MLAKSGQHRPKSAKLWPELAKFDQTRLIWANLGQFRLRAANLWRSSDPFWPNSAKPASFADRWLKFGRFGPNSANIIQTSAEFG